MEFLEESLIEFVEDSLIEFWIETPGEILDRILGKSLVEILA